MKHPAPRWLALLCAGLSLAAQAADLTVSAAASLSNAFRDIAPLFEAAHPGTRVRLNFGASGALLQQAAKGAPADVLASADQETMDQAVAQGLVRTAMRHNFTSNTLVLIVPSASTHTPRALADLAQPVYGRITIGQPASVPVGRYAQGVLEAAGLWPTLQPRLINASSVRQALDYVARAEVDAGFVYATDAALMAGKVKPVLTLPTAKPILYPVATLAAAPNAAGGEQFVAFLFTPAAQAVLTRYGFGKP